VLPCELEPVALKLLVLAPWFDVLCRCNDRSHEGILHVLRVLLLQLLLSPLLLSSCRYMDKGRDCIEQGKLYARLLGALGKAGLRV
jgi:hypothetical protein